MASARRLLPRGRTLPDDEFRRRHRLLLVLLWLHAVAVPVWGVARGYTPVHSLVEGGAVAVCAAAAMVAGRRSRDAGAALVSLGLLTASAVIVHLSGGIIEAHFHFFVAVVLLTLYEDWTVFVLAAIFVVLHHGLGGALAPHAVFNHPDAEAHPWHWAALHSAYIGAAGLAAIVTWRLNEDLRDRQVALIAEREAALERVAAAEREIERHARELERSNRELEDFASIASHDLSAPLITVAGFLTLLEERYGGRLDPEADELVGHALEGTERMHRLIQDLLEYSRAGRAGLPAHEVDLTAVVREALVALGATVEETGAEVVVDPLPTVRGDARGLGRLMQNLISNALKYTGGVRPVVHVSAREHGGGLEISVVDNGIGVDAPEREAVFRMLHRSAGSAAVDGSGIGLAICDRIVEGHGGRIWVEPAAGGGSAFRFTLPDTARARTMRGPVADARRATAA